MAAISFDVTYGEIDRRMDHHPPVDGVTIKGHSVLRELTKALAKAYVDLLPPGREKSMAISALGDALMYGNQAIAINGGPVPNTEDKVETIADDFSRHYGA